MMMMWGRRMALGIAGTMGLASSALAGEWQWGCMGPLGADHIVFQRTELVVIGGKAPPGPLDDYVLRDGLGKLREGTKAPNILATYEAEDVNSGLDAKLTFVAPGSGSTLTLTEQASRTISRRQALIAHCRDEERARVRKTYLVERTGAAPVTTTLTCLEYTLSTRGGRQCR